MPSFVPAKKNTAYTFYVSLVSQADTKLFQANPTLAAGDFRVAIDDGAPANLGTLPVVDADFTKRVKVVMSASEMNGDNITIIASDAAGAQWCDQTWNIQTTERQIDDLAFPATSGRSMVVDAAGLVDANTVKLGPTGAGTAQTARDVGGNVDVAVSTRASASVLGTPAGASIAADVAAVQADTDNLQTRIPGALVGGKMDSTVAGLETDAASDPAALAGLMPATNTRISKIDWIFARLFRKSTFNKTTGARTLHDSAEAAIAKQIATDDGTTTTLPQTGAP